MINDKGLSIIKAHESCKLFAYYCPAKVLTIGWGHTGPNVKSGMRISQFMADSLLKSDCLVAELAIKQKLKVEINQNQLSALISLVFNIGQGNFTKSTMLELINKNEMALAADEFVKWCKADGRVLQGLKDRRKSEQELFLAK